MDKETFMLRHIEAAIDEWLKLIAPRVLTDATVTASATPFINLEAVLAGTAEWLGAYRQQVTPHLWALILASTVDALDDRQVGISAGIEPSGELTEEQQAIVAEAVKLGAAAETAALVIQLPTWHDYVARYVDNATNKVVGMPEETYRLMLKALNSAQLEGEGIFERARITRACLNIKDEGGYARWQERAVRIARTETNNAMNGATFNAAQIEQELTGETLRKAWVATLDGRTRDTHFEADGQIVPLDGKFEINGYECDHPGDQTLPAAEAIQCRCTMLILGEGENLPGEHDRQTERERSDGTTRSPANEVARRAERGITRARDNNLTASATEQEKPMRTRFTGVLAPIGERTGDGRAFDPECVITARATPLPLQWQKHTNGGHDTAVIVGKIDNITVTDTAVEADGVLFDTPEATEAKALIEDGVIRPSVDLVDVEAEYIYEDKDGNRVDPDAEGFDPDAVREIVNITAGKVAGATLVSTPAFENTAIILGEQVDGQEGDTLVASVLTADTLAPVECFRDPELDGPTALTVTENGRVFGHLALWGTKHIGGNGATPPHSKTNYALFHVSTLPTTGGSVSVGRLTVGCGHADTSMGMRQAAAHYDTVGSTWAFVKAGEDKHGIWVAGVVNPTCDPDLVRMGAASPLSGDWRRVGSNLELVAALSVNVPGFPVPRSYSAREDSVMSLVAAGVPTKADTEFQNRVRAVVDEYEAEKSRAVESRRLAARVLKGSVDVD